MLRLLAKTQTFCKTKGALLLQELHKILDAAADYQSLRRHFSSGSGVHLAVGLTNAHKAHYIYSLCVALGKAAHVVMPNETVAARMRDDLNTLFGRDDAVLFPARELVLTNVEGASREYEHMRLAALGRIRAGNCRVVVSPAEGSVQYTIPPKEFDKASICLKAGERHSLDDLCSLLVSAGYSRTEQVEGVAQFALRGGILDFFPPGALHPFRAEFWGDEIDLIAAFDIATQRRAHSVEDALITPARESLVTDKERLIQLLQNQKKQLRGKYGELAKEYIDKDIAALEDGLEIVGADKYLPILYDGYKSSLFDYCEDMLLIVCEPVSIKESMKNASWQEQEDIKLLLSQGVLFKGCDIFGLDFVEITKIITNRKSAVMDAFMRSLPDIALKSTAQSSANQLSVWSGEYNLLKEDVVSYIERGYCVLVFAGSPRAAAALEDDLRRDNITATSISDVDRLKAGQVYLLEGTLSAGVEYPEIKLAVITHAKSAAHPQNKRQKRGKDEKKIKTLTDLSVGDFVVHSSHGIGVFEGIVKRDMQGVLKDYIKIRYAGTDMLFVPVTQLDLVNKYIGAAPGAHVRLSRLNSQEWNKTRQRVKAAVKDMAKELTALYAARLGATGYAFSPDSDWQRDFEIRFPYEETDDQLKCVDQIKNDMQKSSPMDRLLCGDVGFGKTEVALRAIFKCVLDSKQCAVLVPTTILAWQHYQTFTKRLEGYPIVVELLSRFKSPKEQAEIINRVKQGKVDILIGTHRVVQKDIAFKDLGLCVIDEEQRFGVAHKEKFKEMRASVDVLTLSATPIPRTLNMAMSGIRDMSVIEEAPQDRHPVQTYVLEHDAGVIAQAISKELRRGGQVFYLHNHIDSIDNCASKLQELLPEARIVTAHGRVNEEKLSDIWRKLVEHQVDILVCTTIIETGVDVPNCNTLIIEDADKMGLAQLYQLRGRVGRSSRRAYAYLTFKKGKAVSDIATKRLSAIREFTTFGSGLRIAMRDLEIRGAGDILGAHQHGHMEAVGYDLYLRLLGEAVNEEQGKPTRQSTECVIDLRLSAHIPEKYIENLPQRIDIYTKIAGVQTNDDALDIIDELIDRFGDPPNAVKGLIDVALMRNTASQLGIKEISQKEDKVLLYPEDLDMDKAASLASAMKGRVMLSLGEKPYIAVKVAPGESTIDTVRETLGTLVGREV